MKHLTTVALGGLVAAAGAMPALAADLPLVEPVEYVRICDTWGNGFYYIPGTNTCLQISGQVRAELNYLESHHSYNRGSVPLSPTGLISGALGQVVGDPADNVFAGGSNSLGRINDTIFVTAPTARVQFDARTQTEYGTLRSYIRFEGDGGGAVGISEAFIQFGGLTAGRAQSIYDFANYPTYITLGSDVILEQFTYSASFGNGFTASIGIEDRTDRQVGMPLSGYAGQSMPNVVAALGVTQAWGSAQLSGAIQQLRDAGTGLNPSVYASTEYGFAVQAGVNIELPAIAAGDALFLQAAYADGAVSYAGGTDLAQPWNQLNGIGLFDAIVVPDGAGGFDIKKSKVYNLVGGFTHYWAPNLKSYIAAQYTHANQWGSTLDFSQWVGAAAVVYSPVEDLDFGLEVFYSNLSAKNGTREFYGLQPIDTKDQLGAIFRIERRF